MAFPTLILDKIGSSDHSRRTLQTGGTDAVAVHVGHAGGVQITVVASFTGRADRGSCVGVVALVTDDGVHISSPRAVVPSGTVHTVRDVLPLDLIVILSSEIIKINPKFNVISSMLIAQTKIQVRVTSLLTPSCKVFSMFL